jgi:hypothetical protein
MLVDVSETLAVVPQLNVDGSESEVGPSKRAATKQ